jgi:DNA topoisomerase I
MAKPLIIVESPAKAKTIEKYLDKQYTVKSSVGHIRDLPEKRFGIDVKNGFKMEFEIIKGKEKVIDDLKKSAAKADAIYIATDPDREGEAIGWHIKELLDKQKKENVYRVLFYEITKKSVQKALENPGQIDMHKVDAQMTRRILDRLVGYELSPLLSKRLRRRSNTFLSAGRVQSVALKLIVDREEEIRKFIIEEYWSILADFKTKDDKIFQAKLFSIDQQKIDNKNFKLPSKEYVDSLIKELKKSSYKVSDISTKRIARKPIAPFITSKLQQDAFSKLGFSSQKTMMTAQNLYEGVDLDTGDRVGLITYMRTDSTRISKEAENEAKGYIQEKYGSNYLPDKPRKYKVAKAAQEAHEAIRPTSIYRTPKEVEKFLTKDQFKLYELIWSRFIASQMADAKVDQTTVDIKGDQKYIFRATSSKLVFDGYLAAYKEDIIDPDDQKDNKDEHTELPDLKNNQPLDLSEITQKQHFTEPPPRYTEGSLVKALDEKGIGRPSTYAAIMNKIKSRDYVIVEKRKFVPTDLGIIVTKMLVDSFPKLLNEKFTADMENELDQIEDGEIEWKKLMTDFYEKFQERLENAKTNMKIPIEETDFICEKCGAKMVIKWGQGKRFLSCSKYPDCTNAKNFEYDEETRQLKFIENIETDIVCEKCGKKMLIKKGRFGEFLACSGYPDCKNTKNMEKEQPESSSTETETGDDKKCPECGKEMVLKKGRFGEFLACSDYPDCKTTISLKNKNAQKKYETKESDEVCEKCGKKMLIKQSKGSEFLACSGYPKCKNIKPIPLDIKCPKENCGGDLVQKRGRNRKFFWGCTKYPDCNYATWFKPVNMKCPDCGHSFLVTKYSKEKGNYIACPNEDCSYTQDDTKQQQ